MPADRRANQHQKRDRIPAAEVLRRSRDRVLEWWHADVPSGDVMLAARFGEEARASLPGLATDASAPPDAVFEAVGLQRLRLRRDQGVPEWLGPA
jgi:hypothetical protein